MTKFQEFARANHKAGEAIDEMWHPDIQAEARVMDAELAEQKRKDREKIKDVVLSVDAMEQEFAGSIVLYVGFPGSLRRTQQLTADERAIVSKGLDPVIAKRIGFNKPLFGEFPEYDEFESWRAKTRDEFKKFGIPYLMDGTTVMNILLIPEVEAFAEKVEAEIPERIAKVKAAYAERTSKEAVGTGELYNPRDYRPIESLDTLFKLRRKWNHFGVPDILKEVDAVRWEEERKRTVATWAEIKAKGILLLREQVSDMVERLVEAMEPDKDGNKKKFFGTSVTNLTDFFATFANRNLAGDTELAAQVAKLKELVEGKDLTKFKTDDALRAQIKQAGATISKKLKSMVADAGDRLISFTD